jgi:predicted nucleic acid-binding protein
MEKDAVGYPSHGHTNPDVRRYLASRLPYRGLILDGSTQGIKRLDDLREQLEFYIPISTGAMRRAAELWADARRRGIATADDKEIDADVILAAQAMSVCGLNDELMVATYNERHLSRYVNAYDWRDIKP